MGEGVAQEQESTPQEWVLIHRGRGAPQSDGARPFGKGLIHRGAGRAPTRWGRAPLEKGLFQKCHNEL